jgi:catechol 2,3-dioxygenase-like lactoylglutathione lyase family enzyme
MEVHMPIRRIATVSVPVSDPARAKSFYTDLLGFTVVRDDQSIPDMRWIEIVPAGSGAHLTLVTWFETMPPGSLRGLVLESDDVAADHRRLTGLGVTFDQPPEERPYGVEAVLCDPDGNRLVLLQATSTPCPQRM